MNDLWRLGQTDKIKCSPLDQVKKMRRSYNFIAYFTRDMNAHINIKEEEE